LPQTVVVLVLVLAPPDLDLSAPALCYRTGPGGGGEILGAEEEVGRRGRKRWEEVVVI